MNITILGSGTSHGVPMIGCRCAVCTSSEPRNKRMRPSIVVKSSEGSILVDTTPELRFQALAAGLDQVDAVLMTHTHADHIFGLDDLRRFNDLSGEEIPVYGTPSVLEDIRRIYNYIFMQTQLGGGKPRINLVELQPHFQLCGLDIETFTVMHGSLHVQSYRFTDRTTGKSAAYVTDVNFIPPESMAKLHNLDLLILDAVRYHPHSTHFGLHEALEIVEILKPVQTLLTHLSHDFDHNRLCSETPAGVDPAYDGQIIVL